MNKKIKIFLKKVVSSLETAFFLWNNIFISYLNSDGQEDEESV